jgi:ubiquinone/menaquinone biosynthesis C-methylase UbiE
LFYTTKFQVEGFMHNHPGNRFQDIDRLRSPERIQRLEIERVVQLTLENSSFTSVIDIGTGSGIFAEAFTKHGLTVTGVDANPEMLAAAQSYVPNANLRQAVVEAIPFPDGTFDLAFMGLVLHETDDLHKAMEEASRVCRARLIVLEWPFKQQDFGPGMEERLEPTKVLNLAKEAGFLGGEVIPLEHLVLYRFDKPM